jgi:hypothetical protein
MKQVRNFYTCRLRSALLKFSSVEAVCQIASKMSNVRQVKHIHKYVDKYIHTYINSYALSYIHT